MKLQNARLSIELHELSSPAATAADACSPLLLLHPLGASAATWAMAEPAWQSWRGAVHALDFCGHGQSDRVTGRAYYPELFLVDADRALDAVGDRACVAGAGLGAYVALLLAGSRPDRVPAALLLPGRGLRCGGAAPDVDRQPESIESWEARIQHAASAYADSADPFVATCERDIRPLEYASDFASAARRLLLCESVDPDAGEGTSLEWWRVARQSPASSSAPAQLADALRALAG